MPTPVQKLSGINEVVAERLREAASLLAKQGDNPYRVAAYQRAAAAIAQLDTDLRELLDAGGFEALEEIPGVGKRIAGALAEIVRTGRWTYLEQLRGSAEPHDVFCTIPGVGPTLAKRLHETLHVETLEQLEAALYERPVKPVIGIGPRRLSSLRAALAHALARIRSVRTGAADEPSADMLLDVDREYRTKAEANRLRKIAPKRFNPNGEAWLPILHTTRGRWHFTALFSNTARAHELGKVQDWVVIYFHSDSGGEAQRTIVTETRGPLRGQRVVRGRERDCLSAYERPDPGMGSLDERARSSGWDASEDKEVAVMRIPHELAEEFPAEASRFETLTRTSHEFRRLSTRYDEVNRNIFRIESEDEPSSDEVLEKLKKQRLKLKDEIAVVLAKR